MGVFSSRRPPPETIPGDRIIPLSFWDDQDYARGMSLDITLTFNDVLDPEKLRGALDTLLQKKGWEKFGARLRKNVSLAETPRKLQYPYRTAISDYQAKGKISRISYSRKIY